MYAYNPFTGNLDITAVTYFQGVLASTPTSPSNGWTYIDSSTGNYYIYYGTDWYLLASLVGSMSPATYEILTEVGEILETETGESLMVEH